MIISRQYALRLIKQNKASVVGSAIGNNGFGEYGTIYIVINRHDLQRTDHFKSIGRSVKR